MKKLDDGYYSLFHDESMNLRSIKIHKGFNKTSKFYMQYNSSVDDICMSFDDFKYCEYRNINIPIKFRKE